MRKTLVRVCWLIAFATVLCAAGAATPANASGGSNSLGAVSCVSAKFCVAVGNGPFDSTRFGPPISLIWTGVKWRRVAMKVPPGNAPNSVVVSGVSCRSAAYCVAVGEIGGVPVPLPIAETWNGRTWTLAILPGLSGVIFSGLDDVSCAAVRACVADGWGEALDGNDLPLVETLAGTKWTIRGGALPHGALGAIAGSVSCPAVTYCVLAGQHDTPGAYVPLFESWNGRAFTQMKSPEPDVAWAAGVSCVSVRSCVAVDNLVTNSFDVTSSAEVWNGRAWSMTAPWPNQIPADGLNAVSCAGGRCMGAGAGLSGILAGAVVFNGRKWAMTSFPAPPKGDISQLLDVSCVSAAFCVAVGDVGPSSGLMPVPLSGIWNGRSWKLVATPE